MKRSLFITVLSVGFAAGCLAASVCNFLVPAARAAANLQRWEYICDRNQAKFNEYGKDGWEMVAGGGIATGWFCFKRVLH